MPARILNDMQVFDQPLALQFVRTKQGGQRVARGSRGAASLGMGNTVGTGLAWGDMDSGNH
ncbi:MAG: hypothetical protein NTY41_06000 [Proteobacteria bacterium]|nr:hypothetical protein [Pseudomonadota bacterium]